jgi:predicted RecB family endonuclease
MSDDGSGSGMAPAAIGKAVDRVTSLVELVTTLDQKVISALESLTEMQQTVANFESLGPAGDELVADLKQRVQATDERINRDLDEIKAQIMSKVGDIDVSGLGPRLDRLEEAVFNIERATVNLDKAFEGGLEMLPDFVSRRLKGEAAKKEV